MIVSLLGDLPIVYQKVSSYSKGRLRDRLGRFGMLGMLWGGLPNKNISGGLNKISEHLRPCGVPGRSSHLSACR